MKTVNIKYTIAFIFIFGALMFSGCKSKKTVSIGGSLVNKTQTVLIDDALKSQFSYTTLSTKGSIEVNSKKSSAVYKLIKDEIMQVSVRPLLGIEAFRITFTPDSVIMIDRLNKRYVAESIKSSETIANFDFNFYNLQALLTNQLFIPGKKEIGKSDYNTFDIATNGDNYILQTKGKAKLIYNFSIDATDHIVATQIHSKEKDATLNWVYSDFIKDGKQIYPTSMEASAVIGKKRMAFGITYNKFDIDKDVNIDTAIPARYTKVDFAELMKAYIK